MTHTKKLSRLLTTLFAGAVLLSGFSSAINWNNSNFIDATFWAQSPTSGDIINAVFGSGTTPQTTAYTSNWNNNACTGANIDVVYVPQDGLGSLFSPRTLETNTIYVLTGDQIISQPMNIVGSCVAVISEGTQKIFTHDNGTIQGSNAYLYTNNNAGFILDNISVQNNPGPGAATVVLAENNAKNITINNLRAEDMRVPLYFDATNNIFIRNVSLIRTAGAIGFTGAQNIVIDNAETYNGRGNGIGGINTTNVKIYNSRIYNIAGSDHGISFDNSSYVIISNTLVHSSANEGIYFVGGSFNVLDTVEVFNSNNTNAVVFFNTNNSSFHNLKLHNLLNDAFTVDGGAGHRYYGNIDLYGGILNVTTPGSLLTGYSNNNMGRSTGSITQVATVPEMLGTPITCGLGIFHTNFIPLIAPLCQGQRSAPFTSVNEPYYFGEFVLKQRDAPHFSGNVLYPNFNAYDPELYITDKAFGGRIQTTGGANYITGFAHYTNTNQLNIYSSVAGKIYNISGGDLNTGDPIFANILSGTVTNNNTTITLPRTGDDGLKIITGQLLSGSETSNVYELFRRYDTTAPINPTLLSPLSGALFTGDQIDLLRDPSFDTGAGVSGYNYQVATNSGFTNILFSGTTTDTGVSLTGVGFYPNYYRQVQAIDNLGQASGRATTGAFQYGFDYFDVVVSNSTFPTNSGQTVTITAYDVDGNIITGYNNNVSFSITGIVPPTNPNAPYGNFTLPSNYQFSTTDTGTHTFTGGLTITYPGIYELTVQDTIDGTQLGTVTFTVVGQAPDMFSGTLLISPTSTSGDINITITGSQYPIDYDLGGGSITPQNGTINGSTTIVENLTTLPNADGSYNIVVTISDGGFYTYTMTSTVILDTINPIITTVSPTANQYVNINQPRIERSEVETGAGISGYVVEMSGTSLVYTAVNQTNATYRVGTPLADGPRTMTIYAYDNAGNVGTAAVSFTVDNTAPIIVSGYPSQVVIANPFTFTWNVIDTGGVQSSSFMLRDVYGNPVTPTRTNIFGTTVTPLQLGLGSAIAPGIYKRQVQVVDNVALSTTSPEFTFGVHNAIPGQIQGFMEFQSSFGNVVSFGGNLYTNTTQIQVALFSNIATNVAINGNINPTIVGVPLLMPFPYTLQAINLTAGDGVKNINALFSMGNLNPYSVAKQITLDTTAPIAPSLASPINGTALTGAIPFSRSGASDAGAGLGQYKVEVATDATFSNIVRSGSTGYQTQTITMASGTLGTGIYYRRVNTYDKVSNTNYSAVESFTILPPNSPGTNGNYAVPNTFSIAQINNALTSLLYRSEPVVVGGLTNTQRASVSVSAGTLIKNGTAIGTTGTAVNGDIFEIDLISSSNYNSEVTSTLTIGTKSAIYRIRTATSNNSNGGLNNSQRLQIRIIFDALVDSYRGDESRALAFFQTLANSIESMLDGHNLSNIQRDALEYFLGLINDYIDELGGSNSLNGATYTASNGRVFRITYDSVRIAYTSPDFLKPAFFASFTAFRTHIDRNNPGYTQGFVSGGTINELSNANRGANVLVTPNNKVYRIEHKSNGKRYSPDMLFPKEFDTEAALRSYLTANNR